MRLARPNSSVTGRIIYFGRVAEFSKAAVIERGSISIRKDVQIFEAVFPSGADFQAKPGISRARRV